MLDQTENKQSDTPELEPLTDSVMSGEWSVGATLLRAQRIACFISHILALVAIILVCLWVSSEAMGGGGVSWKEGDAKRVFNWHPIMMVTAMAFMTVATLAFRVPWKRTSRRANKVFHGIQWAVAALCAAVGLTAVFKSHNDRVSGYIANLYSLHSWLGCTVIILYVCQFAIGVLSFGLNVQSITPSMRALALSVHRFVGPTIYNLAALTILLGIQEKEGFIGCSYTVTAADRFPPAHFFDIPLACRISHSIGIVVFFLALCATFAVHDFRAFPAVSDSLSRVQ